MCIDLNIFVVYTLSWQRPRQYTQHTPIISHQRGRPTATEFLQLLRSGAESRGRGGETGALDAKTDGLTVSSNATWTSLFLYFSFNPRACFSRRSLHFSLSVFSYTSEDRGRRFLGNICIYLPDYTMSHHRRPTLLRKRKISDLYNGFSSVLCVPLIYCVPNWFSASKVWPSLTTTCRRLSAVCSKKLFPTSHRFWEFLCVTYGL